MLNLAGVVIQCLSVAFLFAGKEDIDKLIASSEKSTIFSVKEDSVLYIYNLNEHFPVKK